MSAAHFVTPGGGPDLDLRLIDPLGNYIGDGENNQIHYPDNDSQEDVSVYPSTFGLYTVEVTTSGFSSEWQTYISAPPSTTWVSLTENLSPPSVSGNAFAGETLSAYTGMWKGAFPLFTSFQWLRCDGDGASCVAIENATAQKYEPVLEDVSHRLRVTVSVSHSDTGLSAVATSAPSVLVSAAPSGGGGGGGGGAGPDVSVSVVASNPTPAPNEIVEIPVSVVNKYLNLAARGLHATIGLPADTKLVGPPAYDRGSGCLGSVTLDCNLDYLPGNTATLMRFSINVGAAGTKAVTAKLTMTVVDPNEANNTGSVVLDVKSLAVAPKPPATHGTSSINIVVGNSRANVLIGTAGRDLLHGLGGNDRLFGRAGNDRLVGGAGNDRLVGGPGRDVIEGGIGADTIDVRDGSRDSVNCGNGRDTVIADRLDAIARNCETIRRR